LNHLLNEPFSALITDVVIVSVGAAALLLVPALSPAFLNWCVPSDDSRQNTAEVQYHLLQTPLLLAHIIAPQN